MENTLTQFADADIDADIDAQANDTQADAAPARKDNRKEDRHFVTALARGLDVLACFRAFDAELGNAELAQRCGLPKSTISRLTHTLTELGYLQALADPVRYRLGSSALALAPAGQQGADVLSVARPFMQELAELSQGVTSLIVRDRGRMLIYENCQSESYLTLRVPVGSRVSGLTTAAGRAYLLALPPAEQRQALMAFRGDDKVNAAQAEGILSNSRDEQRRLGCTTSFGEWLPDINSIALAFRPGSSLPPMTLSCSGPNALVPPAHLLEKVRPLLLQHIRGIEAALGVAA